MSVTGEPPSGEGEGPVDGSFLAWVGSLLGTGAAGGLLGRGLTLRASRKRERRRGELEDIRVAQDRLTTLRGVFRRRQRDAASVSDDHMSDAEDAFISAYYRVGCGIAQERAQTYIDVGRAYASLDPEVGVAAEEEAFHAAMSALATELERKR